MFISEDGEIDLFKPCETGTEQLADRYTERFTQVAAYDQNSGRILLKNQDSFWIMDGTSLDVWPIPGVNPNPYELHWDHFAWSPDGERLAISRLDGREREAGSTLYLVVGDTGEVVGFQTLEYAIRSKCALGRMADKRRVVITWWRYPGNCGLFFRATQDHGCNEGYIRPGYCLSR